MEVSCTAAVTDDGRRFVRLFPIPYRFLSEDKRFRKYQWIEVDVTPASDGRPESFKIRGESIQIVSEPLSTANHWQARKEYVLPLASPSLCQLKRERDANSCPTLGVFRPKSIRRLVIETAEAQWTPPQLAMLRQMDLFAKTPTEELEKIPFKFKYQFSCNDPECAGHTLSCTDWELGQSWRSWRDKYGPDNWEPQFRAKYERDMIEKFDTYFYVGTVHQHPAGWIIIGIFYPGKSPQAALFY